MTEKQPNPTIVPNPPAPKRWPRRHPILTGVLVVVSVLLLFALSLFIWPVSVDDTSVSDPATSYDEAAARVAAIRAGEEASPELNPTCYSNLLTQGEVTEKVVVFYHGFTSCPEQFRELAEQFYDLGYNVYVPRMPHHGHTDQLSRAMENTTAEELAAFATETIDIARGLGDEVIVGGLSGGGTIATWIIQEHGDVERAVIVSPFLGIGFLPTVLNRPIAHLLDEIPNFWMWWDPSTKDQNAYMPSYSYYGYPIHALAEYLRLGYAAQRDARDNPPGVKAITVITNDNDPAVDNGVTDQLVTLWQDHDDEFLNLVELEEELGLPHDIITPTREDGNPAFVYPLIIRNIELLD